MTISNEKFELADLMGKSTVGKLDHVAAVLSTGQGSLGYEAVSGWLLDHPDKVYPIDYVILFAEAAASGILTKNVEQTHPQAARMAQYLVSHMESSHPAIMKRLPFKFCADRSA